MFTFITNASPRTVATMAAECGINASPRAAAGGIEDVTVTSIREGEAARLTAMLRRGGYWLDRIAPPRIERVARPKAVVFGGPSPVVGLVARITAGTTIESTPEYDALLRRASRG